MGNSYSIMGNPQKNAHGYIIYSLVIPILLSYPDWLQYMRHDKHIHGSEFSNPGSNILAGNTVENHGFHDWFFRRRPWLNPS